MMKRRNFLLFSALGAGAVALPLWYFKFRAQGYNSLLYEPEYLSYILDEAAIGELGTSYRKQNPEEASEPELISLLPESGKAMDDSGLKQIRKRIKTDYEEGAIVCLDGWLLSKTEARQCALFAIHQKS